jgi:predicted ATPase
MDELPKRRNACQAAEEALHSTLIEADRLWGAYWSAKLAEEREHLMIALDHLARYNRIARALGDAHPDPAAAVLIEARATGNAARGRLDDGELLPLLRPESEVLLDRSGAWR